jgi:ribosomal protein L37E
MSTPTTMEIRCRKCGHDHFKLTMKGGELDPRGRFINGELRVTCVRCGGNEFGALDPIEERTLRGSIVPKQLTG